MLSLKSVMRNAVLLLGNHASLDQLRAAMTELVEIKEFHHPLLSSVEVQISRKAG